MVTLIKDPFLKPVESQANACADVMCNDETSHGSMCSHGEVAGETPRGYDGYVEPDTEIPPKAKSVLTEISVNGVIIDEADVLAEAQQHPASSPGEALLLAARALVVRELLLQEAKRLNIKSQPLSGPDGMVETPEDALIRQLTEQQLETPVADNDVRLRFYELNKHRFTSETIYEARHILLAVKEPEEKAAKFNKAQALLETLLAKPDNFRESCKEFSDCSSKMDGGNLGQLTTGSTVPEFEAVLEQMQAGQLWPELVESRFGFHIVHLVNKVPGEILPFEYMDEKIGAWLEASSWSRAVSQYISILAGKASITGIELNGTTSPLVQ